MKQKLKIIAVVVVSIAFIVSLIYLSQQSKSKLPPLSIISSTPADHSTSASLSDPMSIQFSQPVDANSITISSDPTENWSVAQDQSDKVILSHELYLRVATPYVLTVSQNSQNVGTISFETAHEQNDPRYLQGIQLQMDKDYPLAKYTPYENPIYRVVYSAPLTLEITLKTFNLDQNDAITQIETWVKSHGIDPATHKYTVISPSPTPTPSPSLEPSPTD